MICLHLLIRGRVQGVYFRASAQQAAMTAAVRGWVRNTADGSVEAMAEGEEAAVQQFVNWCRQGPPAALVTEVLVEEATLQHFAKFEIRK